MSFNPRARVGRDICSSSQCYGYIMFQSTRPRGARHCKYGLYYRIGGFNPRARVGRDAIFLGYVTLLYSFNPRARVGRDLRSYL